MGMPGGIDSFDPEERKRALAVFAGEQFPNVGDNVNLHAHSFFSYNGDGYSPSHLALIFRRNGLYAAGICDFDVLDGMQEFYGAGLQLGLRTAVHLETRAFLEEFSHVDVNSPGEVGVTYIMGAGFALDPQPDPQQAKGLASLRNQARERNRRLVARINAHLPEVAIDYERDVLALTPSKNATERHIVGAYINRMEENSQEDQARFWADVLERPTSRVRAIMGERSKLEEALRARLVKRGGIGYEQPGRKSFPPVDSFVEWVKSCRAIPMAAWLDGTSFAEKNPDDLLDVLQPKGICAVNIIPDRNWNLTDLAEKRIKLDKMRAFIKAVDRRELPINVGTELNKPGLPLVDDLSGEELGAFRESILKGARIMVGHCVLLRYAGFSYAEADAEFGGRIGEKNRFFESVGALPPLTHSHALELQGMEESKALRYLADAGRRGSWWG